MIRVRDVTKRFGGTLAVDRLTLDVRQGEVVTLLGPNGSGKTTTLKMAAGLVRPDCGSVTIGDPPLPASDPRARRALSFLPQRVAFPETLSGREVVEFYRRLRGTDASREADVLRFASLNGAGERAVGTYSGGMLQRLGLAVAMLPDAGVLLLDEPTAALDPDGLRAFDLLVGERRAQGRTVLFTSHQIEDADLADRVLIMAKGRLAGDYTREQLRQWRQTRGLLRVRVDLPPAGVLERIGALAAGALVQGDEIQVPCPSADRALVLDLIRASGAAVVGLSAEDGRLESLYAEVLAKASQEDGHA